NPSTCGMLMSIVSTSGLSCSVFSTASLPSRASPHTSMDGSALMMLCSTLRMNAESSTINTRIRLPSNAMSLVRPYRRFGLRAGRTDERGDLRQKLVFLHWLHQECRRAFLNGAVLMLRPRARGHHHHRDVARLRRLPQVR